LKEILAATGCSGEIVSVERYSNKENGLCFRLPTNRYKSLYVWFHNNEIQVNIPNHFNKNSWVFNIAEPHAIERSAMHINSIINGHVELV